MRDWNNFYQLGENMRVISPNSHIWKPLKRPRKCLNCEICKSKKNLWAYRGVYVTQTVCEKCLKTARELEIENEKKRSK